MNQRASSSTTYRNLAIVAPRGLVLLAVGGLIVVSMALYATHLPHQPTARGRDASHVTASAFAAIGLVLGWLGKRSIGTGITAGPDGLVVRRVFHRRRRVPWADVTGLELIRARRFDNRFTNRAVAIAILRAGHRPLYCLGCSFAERQPAAEQMLQSLRSEHRSWLAGQIPDGIRP